MSHDPRTMEITTAADTQQVLDVLPPVLPAQSIPEKSTKVRTKKDMAWLGGAGEEEGHQKESGQEYVEKIRAAVMGEDKVTGKEIGAGILSMQDLLEESEDSEPVLSAEFEEKKNDITTVQGWLQEIVDIFTVTGEFASFTKNFVLPDWFISLLGLAKQMQNDGRAPTPESVQGFLQKTVYKKIPIALDAEMQERIAALFTLAMQQYKEAEEGEVKQCIEMLRDNTPDRVKPYFDTILDSQKEVIMMAFLHALLQEKNIDIHTENGSILAQLRQEQKAWPEEIKRYEKEVLIPQVNAGQPREECVAQYTEQQTEHYAQLGRSANELYESVEKTPDIFWDMFQKICAENEENTAWFTRDAFIQEMQTLLCTLELESSVTNMIYITEAWVYLERKVWKLDDDTRYIIEYNKGVFEARYVEKAKGFFESIQNLLQAVVHPFLPEVEAYFVEHETSKAEKQPRVSMEAVQNAVFYMDYCLERMKESLSFYQWKALSALQKSCTNQIVAFQNRVQAMLQMCIAQPIPDVLSHFLQSVLALPDEDRLEGNGRQTSAQIMHPVEEAKLSARHKRLRALQAKKDAPLPEKGGVFSEQEIQEIFKEVNQIVGFAAELDENLVGGLPRDQRNIDTVIWRLHDSLQYWEKYANKNAQDASAQEIHHSLLDSMVFFLGFCMRAGKTTFSDKHQPEEMQHSLLSVHNRRFRERNAIRAHITQQKYTSEAAFNQLMGSVWSFLAQPVHGKLSKKIIRQVEEIDAAEIQNEEAEEAQSVLQGMYILYEADWQEIQAHIRSKKYADAKTYCQKTAARTVDPQKIFYAQCMHAEALFAEFKAFSKKPLMEISMRDLETMHNALMEQQEEARKVLDKARVEQQDPVFAKRVNKARLEEMIAHAELILDKISEETQRIFKRVVRRKEVLHEKRFALQLEYKQSKEAQKKALKAREEKEGKQGLKGQQKNTLQKKPSPYALRRAAIEEEIKKINVLLSGDVDLQKIAVLEKSEKEMRARFALLKERVQKGEAENVVPSSEEIATLAKNKKKNKKKKNKEKEASADEIHAPSSENVVSTPSVETVHKKGPGLFALHVAPIQPQDEKQTDWSALLPDRVKEMMMAAVEGEKGASIALSAGALLHVLFPDLYPMPIDWDFSTSLLPGTISAKFARSPILSPPLQGQVEGQVMLNAQFMGTDQWAEMASYPHLPSDEGNPPVHLFEALVRHAQVHADFTVNGIYLTYTQESGFRLFDAVNNQELKTREALEAIPEIKHRILRLIGSPERMEKEPMLILRALGMVYKKKYQIEEGAEMEREIQKNGARALLRVLHEAVSVEEKEKSAHLRHHFKTKLQPHLKHMEATAPEKYAAAEALLKRLRLSDVVTSSGLEEKKPTLTEKRSALAHLSFPGNAGGKSDVASSKNVARAGR